MRGIYAGAFSTEEEVVAQHKLLKFATRLPIKKPERCDHSVSHGVFNST
jgi:hypothetical protein